MTDDELPADLAQHWYEYWRLRSGNRSERNLLERGRPTEIQQAYDFVAARVDAGGPAAVELLVALAEAAPAGDDGVTVGVGPLEGLIGNRSEGLFRVIATRARQSPAFGRALSHAVLPPDYYAD